MKRLLTLLFCIAGLAAPPALAAKTAHDSGLPVPRFVSLKSAEVNVRSGPGTRYPIAWVYRRDDLPVEVVEEFEHWRKIKDIEGTTGWVHKGMLSGDRHIMTKGEIHTLYKEPDEKSTPVLKVEKGVIGSLLECAEQWCRVQVSGRKAWIKREALFGIYKDEQFKR